MTTVRGLWWSDVILLSHSRESRFGFKVFRPVVPCNGGVRLFETNMAPCSAYASSKPRMVPVEEANLSVSRAMRCSIETNMFGSG